MKKSHSKPSHARVPIVGRVVEIEGRRSIEFENKAYIQHFLKTKCQVGDEVYGELTSKRPKRSVTQNSYYWLYLSLMSESSGHSVDELHTWAKGKFLTTGIKEVFGDKTRKVKSTTELTIGEFCEYMNQIEEVTGIPIPDPAPFKIALLRDEFGRLKEDQKATYRKLKPNVS